MGSIRAELSLTKVSHGKDGTNGIPGMKGEDGRTQYTHIAYANSADGIKDFSVSDSKREYIGMYVDFTEKDSTKPSDYSWSLIKGADGNNGTPGKPGTDGKTPYFHTAWANSQDGKVGFSTTDSVNKFFLGTYTDFEIKDSTEPNKYMWQLVKGEDGKDAKIYTAYAWSADGSDRFTDKYPNDNLWLESQKVDSYQVTEYDNMTLSRAVDSIPELNIDEAVFIRATGASASSQSTLKFIIQNYNKISEDLIDGELYAVTIAIKNMRNIPFDLSLNGFVDGDGNRPTIEIGRDEVSRVTLYGKRVNKNVQIQFRSKTPGVNLYAMFALVKLEEIKEPNLSTIYTPSPQDDFNNAWPPYIGTYVTFEKTQSNKPSDYTWARLRGESGKDGTDGKDGITPKEVVSGYLSNDSIIVPSNAVGQVSDYSKAYGDFIVFEGQVKKNTGVTYSKVSEIGMVSTINSSGRYVISSLSADTGTATYRATYNGISIDKILIVVKNKQGPSGANGKDGVKGDKGDTGNTGATGQKGDPTGVVISATEPNPKFVNMLWKHTGTVSGFLKDGVYRWNGSRWDLFIFIAENISANTLSAISANLGTVTAGTIKGATLLSDFDREVWSGSALKRKGQIEVSGGKFFLNYDEYNKSSGAKLGKGDAYLDESGFTTSQRSLKDEVIKSSAYRPEGILLKDATYTVKYGDALIEYLDAVNIPEFEMPLSWTKQDLVGPYSELDYPRLMRKGRTIQLFGAFKPKKSFSGGTSWLTLATLPKEFSPAGVVAITAQGSGYNTFAIRITPNGDLDVSRHRNRTADGMDFTAGQWLSISCTYTTNN